MSTNVTSLSLREPHITVFELALKSVGADSDKLLQTTSGTRTKCWEPLRISFEFSMNACTGGPRYMRSFYLRFCVYATQKWPFFWNLSSNNQSSLVFLYANSLYASLFLESLALAYNEVQLYSKAGMSNWWPAVTYLTYHSKL